MIAKTEQIMGMPVTIKINDKVAPNLINEVFDLFRAVDKKYSPRKDSSIVSQINRDTIATKGYSAELDEILAIADTTSRETDGYFNVWHNGVFDPSGIVKGWAIHKASKKLALYAKNFYIEAGGDIQVRGNGASGDGWKIGIRNPFNRHENISVVTLRDQAIATSGTAIRGQHIYNPHNDKPIIDVVSLSVIADSILNADRIATSAFAMGRDGIYFLENLNGYEGLVVDNKKLSTKTTGWEQFEVINS